MSDILKFSYLATREFYTKVFKKNKNYIDAVKETFKDFENYLSNKDIVSISIYSSVLKQFRIITISDKNLNFYHLKDLIYFYNELINIYEKCFKDFNISEIEKEYLTENLYICIEDLKKIKLKNNI